MLQLLNFDLERSSSEKKKPTTPKIIEVEGKVQSRFIPDSWRRLDFINWHHSISEKLRKERLENLSFERV